MGFGRRRPHVWNPKTASVKEEKSEENYLTELDVDFEPSVVNLDRSSTASIGAKSVRSLRHSIIDSDLLDIPSIGDKCGGTELDPNRTESANERVPRLNQPLPSLNELEAAATHRTYPFLAHFDHDLDLSELTKHLIPLEQLKNWNSQLAWTWNSLMAELSELLENENVK